MSGRIVHFEIPFDDSERAHAFYENVFGWETDHLPEMDYTLVTTGPSGDRGPTEPGYINGGLFNREYNDAPGAIVVIDVGDIDATLARIEGLGGQTVQGRTQVGGHGMGRLLQGHGGQPHRFVAERRAGLTHQPPPHRAPGGDLPRDRDRPRESSEAPSRGLSLNLPVRRTSPDGRSGNTRREGGRG